MDTSKKISLFKIDIDEEQSKVFLLIFEQNERLQEYLKFILSLKDSKSILTNLKLCDKIIEALESSGKVKNPRQQVKDIFSNLLKYYEVNLKEKVKSTKVEDILGVTKKSTLIGQLFVRNLLNYKVINKWIKNLLINSKNSFIRLNLLTIIKDRVKILINFDNSTNVKSLYEIIKNEGLYDDFELRCKMGAEER